MVNMVGDLVDEEQMGNMLTVQEVARLLHIHPNTLRRWSNRGLIKAYRITPRGDRRFRREEILDFLARLNANHGDSRQADNGQKS
jgi:excisionase family DNA binding protein